MRVGSGDIGLLGVGMGTSENSALSSLVVHDSSLVQQRRAFWSCSCQSKCSMAFTAK